MEEIKKLFRLQNVEKIRECLENIIIIIENSENEEKCNLILEIINESTKKINNLRKQNKLYDVIYNYSERISPIALLAEEIAIDSEIESDMLKILKLNLNQYFKRLKEAEELDWHISQDTINLAFQILENECNYFSILKKLGIKLSVFNFKQKLRNMQIQLVNYDAVKNTHFALHFYYCSKFPQTEDIELCLKQFGFLLKEIVVGQAKKVPDGFIKLYSDIDGVELDEESKDITDLFANTFVAYVVEKMEKRILEYNGEAETEKLSTRNEEFVEKMMVYFDNLFNELKIRIEEQKEIADNEICPCGSQKKYKECCKKKDIRYYKTSNTNEIISSIIIEDEDVKSDIEEIHHEEFLKFKEIFGRFPENEKIIANGASKTDFKRMLSKLKRNEKINNAKLYAFNKTGLILTEQNMKFLPDKKIKEFMDYIDQYELIMNSQADSAKKFQTIQNINRVLEVLVKNKIDDMTYVLNVFVNTYSKYKINEENFAIRDIKDFLVFCAHKTAINLDALKTLVNEEYYDNAMAVVRIIYEILINVRAYKNDKILFKNKILPVAGIDLGTHKKISKYEIEEIKTGEIYKYEIQKYQLAERAGENFKKLYNILYKQ